MFSVAQLKPTELSQGPVKLLNATDGAALPASRGQAPPTNWENYNYG